MIFLSYNISSIKYSFIEEVSQSKGDKIELMNNIFPPKGKLLPWRAGAMALLSSDAITVFIPSRAATAIIQIKEI